MPRWLRALVSTPLAFNKRGQRTLDARRAEVVGDGRRPGEESHYVSTLGRHGLRIGQVWWGAVFLGRRARTERTVEAVLGARNIAWTCVRGILVGSFEAVRQSRCLDKSPMRFS